MINVRYRRYEAVGSWFLNSGLFYLGWIYVLKGVIDGHYVWGIFLTSLIIILHLCRVSRRLFETTLIATMMAFGPLFDTILINTGVLSYEGTLACCPWLAPPWIAALWGLFATSINHSLAWVGRSWWLTAGTGAVGGTLSYLGAIKAGAAHFEVDATSGTLYLILAWTLALPCCYAYNRWLSRMFQRHIEK